MDYSKLLRSQVVPLPEDILKKKWAGELDGALAAIDAHLQRELPEMLKDRLTIERELIQRLPREYPYTRAQILAEIREHIGDFTGDEFDRYEADGGIDFIYCGGEKRYYNSVYEMLKDWDPSLIARAGGQLSASRPTYDAAVAETLEKGSLGYRIRIRAQFSIRDEAFVPGETYRVHLPVPKPCAQQSNIRVFADPDGYIAPENAPQRTVFYERTLKENAPFSVEYEYDNRVVSMHSGALPVYPNVAPPTQADLGELPPHLMFTPYLRWLSSELKGNLTEPLQIARAYYDFITKNVRYSYLRDYLLVDNVAEYTATSLKGDCGAQVLLFMALCRIAGIPARWQSCTNACADSTGAHDWAQFYVQPYGWLLCDPSKGGGAYKSGGLERWNFYFGHLDPFRMVANDQYFAEFDPPKAHLRIDPYDNQSGECETPTRALKAGETRIKRTLVALQKL